MFNRDNNVMKSKDEMPNTCIFQDEAQRLLRAKLAEKKDEVCETCGGPIK